MGKEGSNVNTKGVTRVVAGLLLLALLAVPFVGACARPAPSPAPAAKAEPVKFVVGINTGLTGGAAWCFTPESMGVKDALAEANKVGAIPGIEFKVVEYDNEYKAEKTPLGYRYCKEQGAKIIFSVPVQDVESMLPLAKEDKIVLVSHQNSRVATDVPSWAFCLNLPTEYSAAASVYAIVNMVWNYDKEKRVPNISGIAWDNAMGRRTIEGAKAACDKVKDKANWIGEIIVPPGTIEYTDSARILHEKKADFIISGLISSVAVPVMKLIRAQGYKYRLFWQDPGISGWGLAVKQRATPEELAGHYWFGSFGWPTRDIEGYKEVYHEKLPMYRAKADVDKWVLLEGYEYGVGWTVGQQIIECVKKAGPANLTPDGLYKAMETIKVDSKGRAGPEPLIWSAENYHTGNQVGRVYQIQYPSGDPYPVSDWVKIERKF